MKIKRPKLIWFIAILGLIGAVISIYFAFRNYSISPRNDVLFLTLLQTFIGIVIMAGIFMMDRISFNSYFLLCGFTQANLYFLDKWNLSTFIVVLITCVILIYHYKGTRKLFENKVAEIGLYLIFIFSTFTPHLLPLDKPASVPKPKTSLLPFKKLLVNNNFDLNIFGKNNFENLDTINNPKEIHYSNMYYKFGMSLPKGFNIDRGNADNTVIRLYNSDYGITLTTIVTPIENFDSSSLKIYKEDPIGFYTKKMKGNYVDFMTRNLVNNSDLTPINPTATNETIRSYSFIKFSYNYVEEVKNVKIKFKSTTYSILSDGFNINFDYSAPVIIYDENLLYDVVYSFNKINSKMRIK